MNITVLDFEQVAKCYKPYVEGIYALEQRAQDHREAINSLQTEAEGIIKSEESLVLDDSTKQENRQRIQALQQEAMLKDQTFKADADETQRKLVGEAYEGITNVVNKFVSDSDDVDMVLNRSEVVYFSEDNNITEKIIEELKTADLYTEQRLRGPEQPQQ